MPLVRSWSFNALLAPCSKVLALLSSSMMLETFCSVRSQQDQRERLRCVGFVKDDARNSDANLRI